MGTDCLEKINDNPDILKQFNFISEDQIEEIINELNSFIEKVMSKLVSSHKRKSLEELSEEGFNENWLEWIKTSLSVLDWLLQSTSC